MIPQQQAPQHAHQSPGRVIVHIDLDCFYCQVEQKRLNIPADVPCAVQQWNGLIAVNYAARAAGVTRHMRVLEAKKICPQLQTVHVQTIGGEHAAAGAAGPSEAAEADSASGHTADEQAAADGQAAAAEGDVEGSAADRGTAKASLQRYRKASAEIMRLLAQSSPGCAFEKASIDEAYIDITQLAAQELSHAEAQDGGLAELLGSAGAASHVLGDGGLQAHLDFDRLVAAGAVIALRLRTAVAQELGFTCSAGIGPNKLLAKIGSAKNKPNKQTVVLPRAVEGLMEDLSLGKVKGLGGKLGHKLESLGASTAGAAAGLSWEVLVDAFGSKALWVWETVRGIDNEPVTPKSLVKSINSCKSFEPTSEPATVSRWLAVLAAELAERMAEDEADHTRRARTLVLQYRTSYVKNAPERSIRGPLPRCGREGHSAQSLAAAGMALFKRIIPAPFPLVRLALAATDFADLPGHGSGGSSAALQRFLAAGQQQQQQQHRGHQGHQQQPLQQQQEQPPSDGPSDADEQVRQQQQQHGSGVQPPPPPRQHHRRHAAGRQQQPGQTRLEQFAKPQAASVQRPGSGPDQSLCQQQQPPLPAPPPQHHQQQHSGPSPLYQVPQEVQQQQQQESGAGSPAAAGGMQPCQEQAGETAMQPPGLQQVPPQPVAAGDADASSIQHAEQPQPQEQQSVDQQMWQQDEQQPESLKEVAALAGVDLASQARMLRDIEIRGMMKGRREQQHAAGAGNSSQQHAGRAPGGKRKANGQQGQQSGKQMRISSMFGKQ